jgi:hypothetical protein
MRAGRWIGLVAIAAMLALALSAAGCDSDDGGSTAEEGVAVVELTWESPMDLDVEIWDSEGTQQLTAAWAQGHDVTSGGEGTEYFEFIEFEGTDEGTGGDFTTGEYTVFVYVADDAGETEAADFELTVTDAEGGVTTYSEAVTAEAPNNLWRGFRIDAATGEIVEELDEFVGDQLE